MSATTVSETPGTDTRQRRRLGVPAVTVLIIAASAPLTVIAGGATTAYSVTGSIAVPIGYIVLAVVLAIFSIGYAAMSRFITNAGAFAAYAAQGLGRPVGVGVSLIALVAYSCMQIGIWGMFGFQVSTLLAEKFGIDLPWWVGVIVFVVVVGILGVNRVDLSAKVLGVIVALEFIAVTVFDVVAFANPVEGFTADPISPASLLLPGIGAVLVFGIAAFMGFESAAIYGEEAKDPKRTVARATFAAVVIIGVFYALSSWALALAIGTDKISSGGITVEEAGPPLFFGFVAERLGLVMVDFMSLLFITSLFAALVSFHNAVARYLFSLGRDGVLPSGLASVRERSGAPWAGSIAQSISAVVVIVAFAIAGTGSELGPLFPVVTLFSWLTNTGALGLVLLMAVVSLAVIGFFRRDARDVGVGSRLIAPIIAFLALATVLVLIVANFNVLLDQAESNALTFVLPGLIVAAGIAGAVWALVLRVRRPEVYARIGRGAEQASAEHLG
ncbi:APC family permease [Agromyces larvae]|uniref:APC family permease n=1 Tax=Agromyces larvae TaxID=2929802 RepID=A0ABY4C1T1_9MICO|nr:APC family permease [Agromyces larvae]UOE44402.1 APC family permease [Agromyces larvae]